MLGGGEAPERELVGGVVGVEAEECGACGVALLVEPVGVDVAAGRVAGIGEHGSEEISLARGQGQRIDMRGGRRWVAGARAMPAVSQGSVTERAVGDEGDRVEAGRELEGVGGAPRRVAVEACVDDLDEGRREIDTRDVEGRERLHHDVRGELEARACERWRAGEQPVGEGSEGVDVGGGCQGTAGDLVRRERRPDRRWGHEVLAVLAEQQGRFAVEEDRDVAAIARGLDPDRGGLEGAVDDAVGVEGGEPGEDAVEDPHETMRIARMDGIVGGGMLGGQAMAVPMGAHDEDAVIDDLDREDLVDVRRTQIEERLEAIPDRGGLLGGVTRHVEERQHDGAPGAELVAAEDEAGVELLANARDAVVADDGGWQDVARTVERARRERVARCVGEVVEAAKAEHLTTEKLALE